MKVPCDIHGAHFRQEFTQTLKADCTVWEKWGMAKLPVEDKLLFWQWLFKAPFDEIWLRSGFQIGLIVIAERKRAKHLWEKIIKGYGRMTEAQRQAAQKAYFKKSMKGKNGQ